MTIKVDTESLATNSETNLSLMVRNWGAEWGGCKFDVYIDDEKLVTEDNTNRWNQSMFKDVFYQIPDSKVNGKSHVRVKFKAQQWNTAGAVYGEITPYRKQVEWVVNY